ncbi:DUF2341 domain-containing protein [uncultured Methanolobus sp.]|uniref:DUF2341 domain-containing protein n=1 Tax=uncultured Methanolobus sp. TaxID=218300 RepID=UPI002AAAC27C|nr:DUF2341 domain-containing protein [uncultured Methanolobus sp.]
MLQNISFQIKKLLAIFMIVVLLTPNVYCLENADAEQDVDIGDSQLDSASIENDNINSADKGEESEKTPEEIVESKDTDNTETMLPNEVASLSSEPAEDIDPFSNVKNDLNPSLEIDNNYFDTSLFTGSFVYKYPIETVRGRANLEPGVSLTYSSSMGSRGTYGSLGVGWSLNDNCIVRDTRYTSNNTSDDRFILVLDGSSSKLVYVADDDSYHTETERFMRITKKANGNNSFGDYWLLEMPDGTKYRFGYNDDSEQRNSVESRNYISKWWLDQIEDVNGNKIIYIYVENPEEGEIGSTYLDRILYNDGLSAVHFNFTEKTHNFSVYEYSNKINEKKLISNISVLNNGVVLWKYELGYEYQQSKLFLTSIKKTGQHDSTLPPTIFEYDSLTGWGQTSLDMPISFAEGDRGKRIADVNGDGLDDVLIGFRSDSGELELMTWLNTGDGWRAKTSWAPPTYFRNFTEDAGTRLADVNGDGLVDIIQNGEYSDSAWINTGEGWEQNSSWIPPIRIGYKKDEGVRIADINGDGLPDLLQGYKAGDGTYIWGAYINNGTGWEQNDLWKSPVLLSNNGSDAGGRIIDVNGDGLADIIQNDGNATNGWLNNGSGWEQDSSWVPPIQIMSSYYGANLADVNGDGLVDIIRGYYDYHDNGSEIYDAWINTGDGWEQDNTWNPPVYFANYSFNPGTRFADLNGDGLTDLFKESDVWINTNNDTTQGYRTPGLLKEIKHSAGGITNIRYAPSTTFDNTGDDDIPDLLSKMWVTSQAIRDNGISGSKNVVSITNYTYKNGMQYFDLPENIEFRGFGEVTVENNYSVTKHFFHQDAALKGIKNHTEVWDKDGNIYSLSEMNYTGQQIYPGINLILLNSESTTQFDGLSQNPGSSTGWSSFIEYEEYDDYGNPLSIAAYGDTDIIGDERYLNYEYANEEDSWILGKKTHEWLEDSNHVNKSELWHYYDDSSDNSNINKGQLSKSVSWNDMGDNPTVLYDYDNYGNIIQITNPKGFSENIGYDENEIYPVSIENGLGQKEYYEYNDAGRVTKIEDSNGVSTEYVYDDMHRITKVVRPYDNVSSPSIEYIYYQDGVAPESILTKTKERESENFSLVESFDGFGQPIYKEYEGENGLITQRTTYNELGLVESEEVPHYTNHSCLSVTYEYDPIGRPIVFTNTDNTTLTYNYELENTTITNQNGVDKTLTRDIFGNIVKVYEFNEGETYVTSYSYDVMDNLIEITPDTQTAGHSGTESNYSSGFILPGFSNNKAITISPSADGTLTDYQMSFNITYEPEMQPDFDDLRFADEKGVLLPYWIEDKTNSSSAKVWVKVPEIDATSGVTIKMYYGNSTVESESDGDAVFEFFDDFSSSLDTDKWTIVYNTPNGGNCDVVTEDGKLKVSAQGPAYAVQAEAYVKTKSSFNYENTPLEIEYLADQVISSGEGVWWKSGFILSNDTTMPNKRGGGSYTPDNGISIRQPQDGYRNEGTAIIAQSYVGSSPIPIYYTSHDPGSHKFNLVVDKENATLCVDDVMVAENVEHNLTEYDSYVYFLRSSDQYIWNTQKWDYVIVRQHAFNEPTYSISETIDEASFSDDKIITISPSSDGTLTDYQMSFTITYEPEMQTDFDDLRFTDEYSIPIPYWIESMTNSSSAKVWVKVPEIKVTSGATIKMYYGNSTVESESNGDEVFEFFDDFSSSLDIDKWTTAYNTPDGGSYDVGTEDGKLKVSARGPSYAVQADAYAKTKDSFNFESTLLEIEYSADQVISSGEGAWWYSGFIFSNDTTMHHKYCGGHYVPDNGIAIRQPLDGYGSTGAAINVNSYVDSSSTSIYHTTDNPGSHKFNLIMDKENVTLYVDDVMVAENVEHNLVDYDSYIYFLRSSDQYIWNTQKWDYVIVRQHAFNEPTYVISDSELGSFSNAGCVYFTYDSLSRKTSMSDPDMGNWTYEYDLNSNLINQTDARGVTTSMSYDALDRITAIDYPNDDDVGFTYDLEYNGTLSEATKGRVSSAYDYDLRYRVENETVSYGLLHYIYTTSYEYDSMDRATRITYPDASSVNLTYNAQTLLESVEGVVDNLDYNARNQLTTKELSNGVVTNYTYDTEKLLLDRIYTQSLQDLDYDFDNVGNILEIEDNVLNSVKTYGYDDLDRLTSAGRSVNSTLTYQREFTYDRYGCIRQVDENSVTISSYGYSMMPFHAPVSYNGNDLEYDANGNLIEDGDFTYIYNDANQLSEVRYSSNGSFVEKYWYDASGRRVKKLNSAYSFTHYVNKFYEDDDNTATRYFFRDDERVAKETGGDMEWYLSDHLGSTTLLINESGAEVERTEYYPYGQVQSSGLEKYGFTGQENDADTGLMNYGARYYSPEYRVFVQPDTMLPDPYNPQYLNRYAYSLNNPVKYVDPSGHIVFVPVLIGAGMLVLNAWSYYELYQSVVAWNNNDPNMPTERLLAEAVLTLPITGGGLAKLGIKISKSKKFASAIKAGFKKEKWRGAFRPVEKSIDKDLYEIAGEALLFSTSYAGSEILGIGLDGMVEENTAEGTRLGDGLRYPHIDYSSAMRLLMQYGSWEAVYEAYLNGEWGEYINVFGPKWPVL